MLALASHSIGLNCTLFRKIEHTKRNIKFKLETCPQNAIKKKISRGARLKGLLSKFTRAIKWEKIQGFEHIPEIWQPPLLGAEKEYISCVGQTIKF